MEPLKTLQSPVNVQEGAIAGFLLPFGLPDVQAAYKTLFEAGAEVLKLMGVIGSFDREITMAGFPGFLGGLTKAPFDVIGDTLRGTKGIIMDMYQRPEKLLKAMEVLTPLMINMGVSMAKMHGNPLTLITLHKGADGFMSDKQFKTFYWPSLKNLILGLIDEGCVPLLFVEGSYNSRLEVIRDIPGGKTIWLFDLTDMEKAKKTMEGRACIGGNVPIALLTVGKPEEVKAYVKNLIDTVGKDGGYIMANGAVINEGKPENLKAMIDFTKEYGIY
jgi:uroporphyrinogen-III decarboxylase